MSTKSLYAKSDFSSCGVSGTALASVDLTDSEGLRDMLRALKTADVSDLDYDSLMSKVLVNFEHKFIDDGTEAVQGLMGGDALVFLDKLDGCVLVNVRKYETRSIAEPPTGGVTKGPREGFIENMKSNLSMIERKLRTTAEYYLMYHPTRLQPRFDVAEVYAPQGVRTDRPDIYYIESAF